jgi:hypothetical protein
MFQAAADVLNRLSDLSMPSRVYSDLTGLKNQSQIPIQNLTSAGTALPKERPEGAKSQSLSLCLVHSVFISR